MADVLATIDDPEIRAKVQSLVARLEAVEAMCGDDVGRQIRMLFQRLQTVEVAAIRFFGGGEDSVAIAARLHAVEAAMREVILAQVPPPPLPEHHAAPPPSARASYRQLPKRQIAPPAPPPQEQETVPPPPPPSEKAELVLAPPPPPPEPESAVAATSRLVAVPAAPAVSIYDYAVLKAGAALPADVDPTNREQHLTEAEFKKHLGVTKAEFAQLPKWKRDGKKKAAGLF